MLSFCSSQTFPRTWTELTRATSSPRSTNSTRKLLSLSFSCIRWQMMTSAPSHTGLNLLLKKVRKLVLLTFRFKNYFRLVPKAWTHGLRDNEFAQRILIEDFNDLGSKKNKPLIGSIKNMLCLVDERIQCRLASRPWHEPAQALQMRSSPQIDSCCGHEISSKAYDSRFKAS